MRKLLAFLSAFALTVLPANAQFMTGGGFGGSGGGGGGGGVTSLSWPCPTTSAQTGAVTFGNGVTEIHETSAFNPSSSQCGAMFTSTGGAPGTLPPIGVSGGDVESPYFVVIKDDDTNNTSMTVNGGGTNINYNGASTSSITLNAGQSVLIVVNAANNLWEATSTATGTVPAWHPGYISGQFYNLNTLYVVATGSAQTASTVYCTLQQLNVTETFKGMGAYFSTGVASGNVSYAMFNAGAGRPSTLIDYAGPVAAPTSAGASTASLHNTTDTLSAGDYFFCETQDNTTGIINTIYSAAFAGTSAWVGSAAPLAATAAATSSSGISCTAASTCGNSYAAWSAGAFTWNSFITTPTWTTTGLSTTVPLIEVQAN